VRQVVDTLAALYGTTSAALAEQTAANFHTLFRP
jgi:Tat protein secretion system quality control protein TatD with DNase activity